MIKNKVILATAFILIILGALHMLKNTKKDPFQHVNSMYQSLISDDSLSVATFAGGCFWCMEGPFENLEGVEEAVSGFSGGDIENPTYDQVVAGGTGHRESVQVFYDPSQVSYSDLLHIYWQQIDPTDAGGQFADRGDHYTTAIFYNSEQEKSEAEQQIQELEGKDIYDSPIVTQVLPYTNFYPAEEYHQDFYKKSAKYYQQYKVGSGRAAYIEAAKKYWEEQ